MKFIYTFIFFVTFSVSAFAQYDTIKIPINRQLFHERVLAERNDVDKSDGRLDTLLNISSNQEVNLQVTDALYRKVDEIRYWVETKNEIKSDNDKKKYLNYLVLVLRDYRLSKQNHTIKPIELPLILDAVKNSMELIADGRSAVPVFNDLPLEVAHMLQKYLMDVKGANEIKNLVYLKYVDKYPEQIMQTIGPFIQEPFADSLLSVAVKASPAQLYTFAQAKGSPEHKLIFNSKDSAVLAVAKLSEVPNALLYFPFIDDVMNGRKSIDEIRNVVGNGVEGYNGVGYYKLLVQTEKEYYKRMTETGDTPIAMFGTNGLQHMLKKKAIEHFITPINELHDVSNLNVRFKAIDPLNPEELYYMIIMGENDIYTSSYKHSYDRMVKRMGDKPRGDLLLENVGYDHFKKFIKMAAHYNKLDAFLATMSPENSESVMKRFIANLQTTKTLEDAVDVADSYSSISNPKLLNSVLGYVEENENSNIAEGNQRGVLIYGLLKTIFRSLDPANNIDLTSEIGIPSIYQIAKPDLQDKEGRIVQQVFFYGDDDGKQFFPPFVNSFSTADWNIVPKKEWIEFKSKKGNVFVYANRPLDSDQNLDDSAQAHLNVYLAEIGVKPNVVVHRGHSYWLPGTIKRMPDDAKIVVLGSCGGYQNLAQILERSPDAHIISTKEIGAGDINRPILNYLNSNFIKQDPLVWKDMWGNLTKLFSTNAPAHIRETWQDYIPPYRNLGAIFLKGYKLKTHEEL